MVHFFGIFCFFFGGGGGGGGFCVRIENNFNNTKQKKIKRTFENRRKKSKPNIKETKPKENFVLSWWAIVLAKRLPKPKKKKNDTKKGKKKKLSIFLTRKA